MNFIATKEFLFPALITVLVGLEFVYFAARVALARSKSGVKVPAISGDPFFERVYRVQVNTLEQMPIFLPGLWFFSVLVSPVAALIMGSVWLVARFAYAHLYYSDSKQRGALFGVNALIQYSFVIGNLIAIIMQIVKLK